MDSDNDLDPFTTIIKLVLLNHFPPKTKIAIHYNKILYQDTNNPYQFIHRFVASLLKPKSFSKECLYLLNLPIKRALVWYDLTKFIPLLISGLLKLKNNYEGNASVIFDHLLKIIQEKNIWEHEILEELEQKPELNNLKKVWEPDIINLIYEHIAKITPGEVFINHKQLILDILNEKETKEILPIINSNSNVL